jgi:hypothetical protein
MDALYALPNDAMVQQAQAPAERLRISAYKSALPSNPMPGSSGMVM